MSLVVGASGGGAAPERSNFFLDLPDELLKIVLSYMTEEEGVQLMEAQRAIQARLIEILGTNQIGYLTLLCKKVSSSFLFTSKEYRKNVESNGEKIGERWEEIAGHCVKPLDLPQLNRISKECGGDIFLEPTKENTSSRDYPLYKRYFEIFFKRKYETLSFFCPPQEKVAKTLGFLGMLIARQQGAQPRVIELAKTEEEDQEKQAMYIEIALSLLSGTYWRVLEVEGREIVHLINKITDEGKRERAMDALMEGCDTKDPFFTSQEFLEELSPIHLVKYLVNTGKVGDCVVTLFEKTMREPEASLKKEVLFRFFHYWCCYGYFFRLFTPALEESLYSKVVALIETLPEEESNAGLFGLLKRRMFMLETGIPFVKREDLYDYPLCILRYFETQVGKEGFSPLHALETLPQIMEQVLEHKRFNDRFGILTPYKNRDLFATGVGEFFRFAMKHARTKEEASRILDSALKQAEAYPSDRRDALMKTILCLDRPGPQYWRTIWDVIMQKRRELIPEILNEEVVL